MTTCCCGDPNCSVLPIEPEDLAAMKGRITLAFDPPIYVSEVASKNDLPSKKRQHVFDWPEGIRMICSRDGSEPGMPLSHHVSVSADHGSPYYCRRNKENWTPQREHAELESRIRDLVGDEIANTLELLMITGNGSVAHYIETTHDEPRHAN